MGKSSDIVDLSEVAIFPLPDVVLLPHGMLPLHIFEHRYRDMMEDVLARDDRPLIAMAQFEKGWKDHYMGTPKIHPQVCVGVVGKHERLPDGRFNLVLGGFARATVVREIQGKSYRRAMLERIVDRPASMPLLEAARQRLRVICVSSSLQHHADASRELLKMVESNHVEVPVLMDVMVHALCENPEIKQRVLGEADVARRIAIGLDALEAEYPSLAPKSRHGSGHGYQPGHGPPSMN